MDTSNDGNNMSKGMHLEEKCVRQARARAEKASESSWHHTGKMGSVQIMQSLASCFMDSVLISDNGVMSAVKGS